MKKIANYISVAVFFTVITMFSLSMLFFQKKTKTNDETKNKGIKAGTVLYVNENFPLKDNLNSLYISVMSLFGKKSYDNICVVDSRLVEITNPDKKAIEENTEALNDFSKKLKVPLYVLTAPTAEGIYYSNPLNQNQNNSQKKIINDIYLKLNKNIAAIDAYGALYAAKEDYIYYNTDKSWSSLGAYKGYIAAAKKLGLEPQTMINYDIEYADSNFKGDLYTKLPYNKISSDKINLFRSKYESNIDKVILSDNTKTEESKSVYFKQALKTSRKTDVFLQGNNYEKITIKTKTENAPRLLILKGSYANNLAVFLTPHYSEITLIDVNKLSSRGESLEEKVDISHYDQILNVMDIDEFSYKNVFNCLKQ